MAAESDERRTIGGDEILLIFRLEYSPDQLGSILLNDRPRNTVRYAILELATASNDLESAISILINTNPILILTKNENTIPF